MSKIFIPKKGATIVLTEDFMGARRGTAGIIQNHGNGAYLTIKAKTKHGTRRMTVRSDILEPIEEAIYLVLSTIATLSPN